MLEPNVGPSLSRQEDNTSADLGHAAPEREPIACAPSRETDVSPSKPLVIHRNCYSRWVYWSSRYFILSRRFLCSNVPPAATIRALTSHYRAFSNRHWRFSKK